MSVRLRNPAQVISGVLLSVVVGAVVASAHATQLLLLIGAGAVVVAALYAPPHVLVGLSLAVLGTMQLSEQHPLQVGPMTVYTTDILLGLLVLRGLIPRPRHQPFRLMTPSVSVPVVLWAAIVLLAGLRGYVSGNSLGQVARLESSMVYPIAFTWGFLRLVAESRFDLRKTIRAVAAVGCGFMLFALYTRMTHHRFSGASGAGVGNVSTSVGNIRRDYGLLSAFEIYPLLALACLTYLINGSQRAVFTRLVLTAAAAATILTFVRGIIFGLAAGALVIVAWAYRHRNANVNIAARLVPLTVIFAMAAVTFAILTPTAARAVAERMLPGVLPQAAGATVNTQFRTQVLREGVTIANDRTFGTGFRDENAMADAGFPPLYIPHSVWGTILAFEGWPGLIAFLWVLAAVLHRSAVARGQRWLQQLVLAAAALTLVQGSAWNVFFSITSGLGMLALLVAARFGIEDDEGEFA